MNYQDINSETIDRWVKSGWEWGQPISHETYEKAKQGIWDMHLSPTKKVPHEWIGEIKGKKILFVLCLLCTMSAPFIGAYSWILLLGRSGVITQLLARIGINIGNIYGFKGILIAQSMKLFPRVVIYMNGAFRSIDNSLLEASQNYGCKGVKMLLKILKTQ